MIVLWMGDGALELPFPESFLPDALFGGNLVIDNCLLIIVHCYWLLLIAES